MSKKKKYTILGVRGRRFVHLQKQPEPTDDTFGVVFYIQNGGRPLTKRQGELLLESHALTLATHFKGSKFAHDYEKACYGTCWKSEKKRKAFDLLRSYRYGQIYDKESGRFG